MNKLDRALDMVAHGLSVMPIWPDGLKAPALPTWNSDHTQLSKHEIRRWYINGNFGIAVICGKVSNNLAVLDIESDEIFQDYWKLGCSLGLEPILSNLPRVLTPGTGRHLYFYCMSDVLGNQALAHDKEQPGYQTTKKAGLLIELKGHGGYVLAPGSPAECHPLNRLYEWEYLTYRDIPILSSDEVDQLVILAQSFDKRRKPERIKQTIATTSGGNRDWNLPGNIFLDHATWDAILAPHGWTLVSERGGICYWRRPGKLSGFSAHTGWNPLDKPAADLLHVFSSNAQPFAELSWYNKFQAFVLLNFNGNESEAAKFLFWLGYNKNEPPQTMLPYDHKLYTANIEQYRKERG